MKIRHKKTGPAVPFFVVTVGAGISFELSPNLDLRAEYDWIDVGLDGDDIDSTTPGDFDSELRTISLGLKLQFC